VKKLRVLLAEDSASDAKLVNIEIERAGYDVTMLRVETAKDMADALARETWDIVISDWSMPSFGAVPALSLLKATGLDIPFIIVSGTIGEETAVEAMRAGAQDFLLKDRLARLVPAIEREIRERESRESERRAVAALRQSERRFARLAESGIVGIATADLSGRMLDVNDAYLHLIGRTREDLATGLSWPDVNPPDWEWRDALTLEQLQTTGVAGPWEQEILHRDGTRVPVLVGVAMLGVDECISFIADLTERKRAEAKLHESEAQLRQAQKLEAIGSLAGGIAHDFNNLLSVILSYSTLGLEALPEGDPLRSDLDEIHRAGQRASDLTRQLLAFSRRQVLQPRLLDLSDVITSMSKMLRRLLGEHIELTLELPASSPNVKVDPGQFEQVVMNLAVNARDAMPSGGMLTIAITDVDLDAAWVAEHVGARVGRHVKVSVVDEGCGMDDATLSRIFEPFFTTKEVRGTGLGLSTVFGIVQQSGGTIWVTSAPRVGTRFEIYFPVANGDTTPLAAAESTAPRGGNETILLVEDDPQVRALACTILRRCGYHVLEAQSGGDALLIGEKYGAEIALLLTDVVMPRLSGRELAERLSIARPELRTLYMSGYTDDEVVRHGVLEAEVAFVQKPFTPQALARAVRETLDTPAIARSR
jgi:two-component system cell cycle sensor histidine kinase/response regulator CckA